MRSFVLVGSLLLVSSLVPFVAASQPLPVGVCAKPNACYGHADACVAAFSWVPQCVDVRCVPVDECIAKCMGMDGCCGAAPCQPQGLVVPVLPVVRALPDVAQGPQCMEVYRQWSAAGVTVTMRDSCHVSVEQDILG